MARSLVHVCTLVLLQSSMSYASRVTLKYATAIQALTASNLTRKDYHCVVLPGAINTNMNNGKVDDSNMALKVLKLTRDKFQKTGLQNSWRKYCATMNIVRGNIAGYAWWDEPLLETIRDAVVGKTGDAFADNTIVITKSFGNSAFANAIYKQFVIPGKHFYWFSCGATWVGKTFQYFGLTTFDFVEKQQFAPRAIESLSLESFSTHDPESVLAAVAQKYVHAALCAVNYFGSSPYSYAKAEASKLMALLSWRSMWSDHKQQAWQEIMDVDDGSTPLHVCIAGWPQECKPPKSCARFKIVEGVNHWQLTTDYIDNLPRNDAVWGDLSQGL
eukprot:TRINITY_DN11592_c0_g1_i2.p1 TRINITY_DN11592_c0_g1~~TRINITY_DN11592_c0_g1_i2.p1  ORF type:complete len:330 (+),score=19.25 TRINITY_DN11592_c0_g1_i2:47-1036(+)